METPDWLCLVMCSCAVLSTAQRWHALAPPNLLSSLIPDQPKVRACFSFVSSRVTSWLLCCCEHVPAHVGCQQRETDVRRTSIMHSRENLCVGFDGNQRPLLTGSNCICSMRAHALLVSGTRVHCVLDFSCSSRHSFYFAVLASFVEETCDGTTSVFSRQPQQQRVHKFDAWVWQARDLCAFTGCGVLSLM